MLKNYVNEEQKLPLFGVGPYMIACMSAVALLGIILSYNLLKSGSVSGWLAWVFRAIGICLMIAGIIIWYIGAMRSDMDNCIEKNQLKTDGIYAYVRNPMYSGWFIAIIGITLLWHNLWLLLVFPIDWLIMTVVLKNTEEKWLRDLYGTEYIEYCEKVNRCIPWIRK